MTGSEIILGRAFVLVAAACLLFACDQPAGLLPTIASLPAATETPAPVWRAIADGLAWRRLLPNNDELAQLIVIRIDPAYYRFRALYRAGLPATLSEWRALEPNASVLINANFFDADYNALGLIVSDGVKSSAPYYERGGSFLIKGGEPAVLANRAPASWLDDDIEQAAQGFPMLVENGERAYRAPSKGERTRRTVIAIDTSGRILLIVAPFLGLSLADLSAYLPRTDLAIEAALNLDGGRSTMLGLPGAETMLPSLEPAPAILAAYPRAGN
ncbi:MAG: phosphodiester glycosidase family protein [Chloroflexi bacterium]|nr:phosphodiester glycosidase family protein [Chloroflexota bacterium]